MARVLIISPDYASHYFPMSALGSAVRSRGHDVTFATGPGIADRVKADGFVHMPLVLGPGSNAGLMRPEHQSTLEREEMQAFFEASRKGMVPTLMHQARNRLRDLLWEPDRVAADLGHHLETLSPNVIVVDQLAFGATAALRGLGREYVAFHPGHPSAVSVGQPYGYPARLPQRLRVSPDELEQLEELCRRVVSRFTDEYNRAVARIDPTVEPVMNAFAARSEPRTLINYPAGLDRGYGLPARAHYIGSSVRRQQPSQQAILDRDRDRPRIFVSLGTFFSQRSDLLQKIVRTFRGENVELVLARGTTPRHVLEPIPGHWTVESYLPQPALLGQCDLVLTHGGNNTVTEALTAGVPLLMGPLSTDQFAGAADIERAGLGRAFDPNFDSESTISDLAHDVLESEAVGRAAALGAHLTANPGQEKAADLIEESLSARAPV